MKECKKGAGMVLGLVMGFGTVAVTSGCMNNEYRQPGSYSTTTVVQEQVPPGYNSYYAVDPLYNNPIPRLQYQSALRQMYGPPPMFGGGYYGGGGYAPWGYGNGLSIGVGGSFRIK